MAGGACVVWCGWMDDLHEGYTARHNSSSRGSLHAESYQLKLLLSSLGCSRAVLCVHSLLVAVVLADG